MKAKTLIVITITITSNKNNSNNKEVYRPLTAIRKTSRRA